MDGPVPRPGRGDRPAHQYHDKADHEIRSQSSGSDTGESIFRCPFFPQMASQEGNASAAGELLEKTEKRLKSIQMQGSNSSIKAAVTITSLGHLFVEIQDEKEIIYFVCDLLYYQKYFKHNLLFFMSKF